MAERDVFFLVMTFIVATTLLVFVWQFLRSRRSGGERDRGWWEGPWDDDEKR